MSVVEHHGVLYRALRSLAPLRRLVRGARAWHSRVRLDGWFLEGRERAGGEPITVCFFGQIENLDYLRSLIFREGKATTTRGRVWCWQAQGLLASEAPRYGLVILQTQRAPDRLPSPDCFVLPSWLAGELDVADALARCHKSDSIKTDLRHIRRSGLSYRVTDDDAELEQFYANCYLPYVRRQHGQGAFVAAYEEIKNDSSHVELLLVERGGDAVAGVYIGNNGNETMEAIELGVKDGAARLVKEGALSAIYYCSLLHAAECGYKKIFLGGSRPFLNDGALRYKRKWGLRVTGPLSSLPDLFILRAAHDSPATESFLCSNPFVHLDGADICGAVFVPPKTSAVAAEEALPRLRRLHGLPGVTRVSLFGLTPAGLSLLSSLRLDSGQDSPPVPSGERCVDTASQQGAEA